MAAESDRDAPVSEGDVLAGRYRVERVLAQGGMGVVVAARHVQLGQRVAIKVLMHNITSKQAVARFLTEAKASALLRSDHVVHVSDVGTLEDGQPFMVMELLEGLDLGQVLDQEGRLSVEQACDYVLQACEGLAEAHAARIVHRDLKPGNLFRALRPDGTDIIKVLDFGVSKALSQDVRAEGHVTTTDAVFGSPLYMSPEQMQSASKADERSDIWSLGVLLYELVTRKMPFDAESMAGLAVRIATDPPTPLTIALPGAPLELEAVIFKCLEKNPDNRYPNVAELAADLEPFAPGARSHVERIQRLMFGSTNPPRPVPSVPSMRKLLVAGSETLGPLDADPSSPMMIPPEKKRRTWPIAVGVALVAAAVFATVMFVRNTNTVVQGAQPQPTSTTATSATATVVASVEPTHAVEASNALREALHVDPPVVSVAATTAATQHHIHSHPTATATTTTTEAPPVHPTATATSTVLTGISRDRK